MNPTSIQILGTVLFALALVHTLCVVPIHKLGTRYPKHAGLFHFLGEVEAVFGIWAFVLIVCMFFMLGKHNTLAYLNERTFIEPMFVFAVMLIAASQPVLSFVQGLLERCAYVFGNKARLVNYFMCLSLLPLLGSLLTEPAAMTLAALSLAGSFFAFANTARLRYLTIGTLFVNISIGGVLTSFAAPPVLMVAGPWKWDSLFMLQNFGWKAAIAVVINASIATWVAKDLLLSLPRHEPSASRGGLPSTLIHLSFLALVVIFAHEPVVFMGLLLLFVAYTVAYPGYQSPLIWRESVMVGCFLAGLVVLGALQAWWLKPLLQSMSPHAVYFGAMGLTAITDNAALTYLAAQVPNLSDTFKYFVVAGAVVGGGLTVIANAPNPAGAAILGPHFPDQEISPLKLLVGALLPTAVALICFLVL
jgi:hypothetical protein